MRRVVVVGRDAPLWLAALAVQRALTPAGVTVAAVELPTALAAADAYPTLPALEALHARIGVDEATTLRATGGVFSLGTNVAGPGTGSFFLGWGSQGAPVDGQPFFPAWLRARAGGLDARLQDFSLTAVAATNGRMMIGNAATAGFARTDYAYSLPAHAYADMLRRLAVRRGIAVQAARTVAVEPDARGGIAAVRPAGGEPLAADLFVDASGLEAVLASATGGRWHSWGDAFPASGRIVARAPVLRSIPPYAEQRVTATGWARLNPTRAATHVIGVHAADLASDDEALARLAEAVGLPLTDAVATGIEPGRSRDAAWQGNCVAVGAAACALDPAFGFDLHLVQLGIVHLLSLFPAGADAAAERAEYNRVMDSHLDRLRDTQQAFYALSPWTGPFWDRARAAAPSTALAHKVASFRARGIVPPLEDETLNENVWQALLVGLGVVPESWPPAADRLSPDAMKAAFRGMFGFISDRVLEQPTHDAYLADLLGGRAA